MTATATRPPGPGPRTGQGRRPEWAPPAPARLAPLQELARLFAPAYGWRGPLPGPSVDPRLITTYAPAAMRRAEAEVDAMAEQASRVDLSQPEPPEAAEALGSSPDRNPDALPESRNRTGLAGLTPEGARSLRRATCALEEQRERLAFWTVTLPEEAMQAIQAADAWATFQDHIRRYLRRALQVAGLPPLACAVAELHPARTARTGRPCPHLHVVFVGRRSRWARWALDRWQLDGIISRACRSATGAACATTAAGNVQPVRRSVSRYLAAYITKGSAPFAVCGANTNGLPRQWWFWTRELRALVLAHLIPVPYPFLRWVHGCRYDLEAAGILHCGEVEVAGGKAPPVHWIRWRTAAGPGSLFADWVELGRPAPA